MKRNVKHFTTWENKNVSVISKTLALLKIIHLALVTNVPTVTIKNKKNSYGKKISVGLNMSPSVMLMKMED